jgi:alanyl-tRNA synthetase
MNTGSEIRQTFLDYFESQGHTVVGSSSLVPQDDPTLLFTNAGMVQFKKVFLGEEKRDFVRAASSQKCVRAGGKHNDLENVGKTARHHTFFEMLGNFSFGDYFKEGAIEMAWELLVERFGLPKERLWVTIYKDDDEAQELWTKVTGIPSEKIVRMDEKDNFWAMGDTGPCGPCSEILIDQGERLGCGGDSCAVGCDCDRYLELWNLVFMQFNRDEGGNLTPLPKPSIDTGLGLERITAILQGKGSNYDTDLFTPTIRFVEELCGLPYGEDDLRDISIKVIADHSRGVSFLLADGVFPSNEGRGYVLRRIIRRAARHGRLLGLKDPFLYKTAGIVIDAMKDAFPELLQRRNTIAERLKREEERFSETLDKGLLILEEEKENLKGIGEKIIPGKVVFDLYATYGFPVDLTANVAEEDGFEIDQTGFEVEMEAHRNLGRESWAGSGGVEMPEVYRSVKAKGVRSAFVGYDHVQVTSTIEAIFSDGIEIDQADKGMTIELVSTETPFYGESGGQVGDTGIIETDDARMEVKDAIRPDPDLIVHRGTLYDGTLRKGDRIRLIVDSEKRDAIARSHSATHILQAVLRQVLGDTVHQAGSKVEPDAFRFDYTHSVPVDQREMDRIEALVNEFVRQNEQVEVRHMDYSEAISQGAMALFGEKYADEVRAVRIGGFSLELCGGTHAHRTGDVGFLKLLSDRSIAADVRRIEALTGRNAVEFVQNQEEELRELGASLKALPREIPEKVAKLLSRQKELEREIGSLRTKLAGGASEDFLERLRDVNGVRVISMKIDIPDQKGMREFGDRIRDRLKSGIILLGSAGEKKAALILMVTPDLAGQFSAKELIGEIAPVVGGSGGGRPTMAQAGGPQIKELDRALEMIYEVVEEKARQKA